jgi:hypothetical protein
VNAALSISPDSVPGPGYQVTASAFGTNVDSCPSGVLEYQFWTDVNDNGVAGDAGDTLLRDWSNEWVYTFNAWSGGRLAVLTRCSSVTACDSGDGSNTATALLSMSCPPGGTHVAFPQTIKLQGGPFSTYIYWTFPSNVDVIRGWLFGTPTAPATSTLRSAGSFSGSVSECLGSNTAPIQNVFLQPDIPVPPDSGFYFLVRGQPSQTCGPAGYATNAPKERPGRDAELEVDPTSVACP